MSSGFLHSSNFVPLSSVVRTSSVMFHASSTCLFPLVCNFMPLSNAMLCRPVLYNTMQCNYDDDPMFQSGMWYFHYYSPVPCRFIKCSGFVQCGAFVQWRALHAADMFIKSTRPSLQSAFNKFWLIKFSPQFKREC